MLLYGSPVPATVYRHLRQRRVAKVLRSDLRYDHAEGILEGGLVQKHFHPFPRKDVSRLDPATLIARELVVYHLISIEFLAQGRKMENAQRVQE